MASKIFVRNRQRRVPVSSRALEDFACEALRECAGVEGIEALPGEIGVTIVSDKAIASLHRRFMGIAGPTDVLTFQHGEIVISAETARANAGAFEVPLERELGLYIVHGLLHLLGFDDQSEKDSRQMRKMESMILRRCRPPAYPVTKRKALSV